MKFAHFADLHLGSWREPKLRDLSTKSFLTAIDQCLAQKVDFILFAGDIFNTSLPSLDILKMVTKKLKEVQDHGLAVYAIPGSHDFSPSGKTMIEVLEHAGLLHNVCKGKVDPETRQIHLDFTIDAKTSAKITGILGRKGQLDRSHYENLYTQNLEEEPGYKIFLFHTTITEMKPRELDKVDSQPVTFLPRKFNYYAGGHIHHPVKIEVPEFGTLTYPGALFPNNFAEIEKFGHGGYYLITVHADRQEVEWIPVKVLSHAKCIRNYTQITPEGLMNDLVNYFEDSTVSNALITIRLSGTIRQGKIADINFKNIFEHLYGRGAYFIMKNTSQLQAEEFQEVKLMPLTADIEEEIIKEHLQQNKTFDSDTELKLAKELLMLLNTTKKEGETVNDFQTRIDHDLNQVFNLR